MIGLLLLSFAQVDTATVTATSSAAPVRANTNVFIKGELANAGSIRLIPKESFIGVRLGALLQETTLFGTIAPKADLMFLEDKLRIGIEIPLNLEIYSGESAANEGEAKQGFDNFGRLRKQDWDDARDYMKILRYLTYGKKEDSFYFNLGQLHATTIGHGQSMRRYASNIDINSTKVGAEVDGYSDYFGFELAVSDVTRGNLFSGLFFVKPAAFVSDNEILKTISVGASWTSDQKAPLTVRRGERVGDAVAGPVLVDDLDTPLTNTRAVNIFGADAEVKVYRDDTSDIKTYADFSKLVNGGTGFTLGMLGRFNFRGDSSLQLLRTRVELRTYDAKFQPSYFDILYELQKYQFITDDNDATPPTKLEYILNRGDERRFGLYLEASYALVEWFIFAAAIELSSEGDDKNLMLHAEIPWEFLDLFATYHQRSLDSLFSFDINDVFFAGARIQLFPFLFVNGRIQKNFEWDRAKFLGLGGYQEELNYQVDVEIGFEI